MTKNPLLFLAHVALYPMESPEGAGTSTDHQRSLVDPSSLPAISSPARNLTNIINIPCEQPATVTTEQRPFRCSSTSNSLPITLSASTMSNRTAASHDKRAPKSSRYRKTVKAEVRVRRRENMERALRIKSLENSPVNDCQLSVLRMVYDEITMYPIESWMVLIAIAIHRAFKQVKNWFSNERQKHKVGEVVSVYTDTGDKVRLRPLASQLRSDWSDSFFEEVVMIYHYRIQRCLRDAQGVAMPKNF